ncbi:hypothetical protein SISSUDRAFT_161529 [Sistotremastrum suecicum HHB10207 ss-3]|uniref:Uncharacterized protein n=1 Tax=Sistotremastrum suecicum HHB10207 ss-3 TaxID=1314776 RepID=A0A166AMY2_9AGAM|nr:hypothetical protein SISSUDRAFT_161529 [Sistotremastrum suecicum HHB10207 ss-3]
MHSMLWCANDSTNCWPVEFCCCCGCFSSPQILRVDASELRAATSKHPDMHLYPTFHRQRVESAHWKSDVEQYIYTPIFIHVLLRLPLLVLNPHASLLPLAKQFDTISASYIIGPAITGIGAMMHWSCSVPPWPPLAILHTQYRIRYQVSNATSWGVMGMGYLFSFYVVSDSADVRNLWPLEPISQFLFFLVTFFWAFGIWSTFHRAGERFDEPTLQQFVPYP